MANDITMKVGVDTKDAEDGFKDVVQMATKSASEAQSQFSDVFKGAFAGGALANIGGQVAGVLQEGVTAAIDAGNNFEKALQSVSAVTGVTGAGLDDLGTRAQDLALQFGGSATTQLEAFQTVLSKFGPDLAKTPEALGTVAESVNVLGKAAGLDAKQSVDALSNAMLQFGVDASDPAKLAQESGRFINVLAASAKVGAAEIPQVSEAILQAGVAAKGAGLSFEETNAAIQGLAVGGKVGSEAGVALRNVIGKLIDGGKEQEGVLAKVGLSYEKLGNTLTTSAEDGGGLASALEMLKGGLDQIKNPAERAAAAGKLFGAENASAAGILLDQVDNIKLFTEGVTGTNEATVQAAINQDTLASRFEKVKAAIEVGLIKAFQALTPIVKFVFDNFATIATVLSPIAVGLAAAGIAAFTSSAGFQAFSLSTFLANSAVITFTASLLANPIFLIAAAAAAAVVGIVAIADAMNVSAEETISNAEAQQKNIETQQQMNKEMQQGEIQTQSLVNEFQTLAGKTKLSADEQKRMQEIQSKLEEKYPKLIDATKSYKENLSGVEQIGKTSTATLGKLRDQSVQLEKEFARASREIIRGKRDLALTDLYDSTTNLVGGATALTDEVEKFKNEIFGAKSTAEIDSATLKLVGIANRLGEAGFGSAEKKNQFVATIRNAAQQSAAYLDFYKKKAVETNTVVKNSDDDTTKNTDLNTKKKSDSKNKELAAIEDLVNEEKRLQATKEQTAKQEAVDQGLTDISIDKKKEMLEEERQRLELLLSVQRQQVTYFGETTKNLNDLANIETTADGKTIARIKGNEQEREKAAKYYTDLQKRITDVGLQLNKISATSTAEAFKSEFERLKKQSDDLKKAVPEKLTTTFAFKITDAEFESEVDELKARLQNTYNELNAIAVNADEKQKIEIQKLLEDNVKQRETIETQSADIIERVKIERQTDADKRRLDLALFDLRVKFDAERKANEGNYTKLEELETAYLIEKARLQEEFDRQNNILYGVQMALQTSMMEQFNIGRLIEEREAGRALREEKQKALQDEESDLEKSLADRSISFEEYQAKIAEIQQKRIDAGLEQEKLGDSLLKDLKLAGDKALSTILTDQGNKLTASANERAQKQIALDAKVSEARKALAELEGKGTLDQFAKAQTDLNKAQAEAAKNDEDVYGFRTSILEEYAGKAITQLSVLAASGKATLADVGKVTLQIAFELLQKQIPIWVASIFGTEVSKMGLAGIATAGVLTGALYGLFAAAQSAAGFKDGVVSLEGDGTETSDSIPAWLSKGESVITARATKNNVDELKWMNETGLPIREFYRMQMSHTSVSEDGQLVHEIRQLKQVTENLGVQITRNTKVDVHGVLHADGNSISAMIEANRKKNSRRF